MTGGNGPSPPRRTLLAVDPSRSVLEAIRGFFPSKGFEVLEASDVSQALQSVSSVVPDVIVADAQTSGKDGCWLYDEVRARPSTTDVPFVFLTVLDDPAKRLPPLRLGADDAMAKPFEVEELHARVARLVERRETFHRVVAGEGAWLSGSVEFLPLADLLQLLALNGKDALLRLRQGTEWGELVLERGEMLHAACGRCTGPKALYRILGWKGACFMLHPLPGPPPECTLRGSTTELVMDGLVSLDEWNRWREQLPPRASRLRLARGARRRLRKQETSAAEKEILARLAPTTTVGALIEGSPLPDADLAEAICNLRERGLLVVQGAA